MNPASLRPWHRVYPSGVAATVEVPAIRLFELVQQQASSAPSREALVWSTASGDRASWTFSQLWSRCLGFAGWLGESGVFREYHDTPPDPANPTDREASPRILLWLPNVPAFVVAYYGSLVCGCIVTAASPALKPEELAAQIRDAAPRAVIVLETDAAGASEALAESGVSNCRIETVTPEGWVVSDDGESGLLPDLTRADVESLALEAAVLQYTSGTTGAAKGAVMSQRNLVANAIQNAHWFGWQNDPHIVNLAVLPLCHTWGMCCCLNSTMYVGGTLVLADQRKGFDPAHTASLVEQHGATVLYGSATMFHRLMDVSGSHAASRTHQLRSLRHAKAGAMLSQGNLKSRWDAFCPNAPLRQGYGLTEASPESHNNPPAAFRAGTVGVPIQSTDCRICDPGDPARVLGPGDTGEVQLAGPQITLGYWRRPGATAAAFAPGLAADFPGGVPGDRRWLRTGDIAVMDADGYLTIVDRMKDLLKFRGYSISPNAIEECLLRHPLVREAVVVGRNDERDGEVPTAFVVLRESGDPAHHHPASAMHRSSHDVTPVDFGGNHEADLRAHCELHLATYEQPRGYVALAAIPKNHVAKPLRRVLRDWVNSMGPTSPGTS